MVRGSPDTVTTRPPARSTRLAQSVPEDAALVVVPGPKKPMLAEEIAALQGYRDRGGALFLMFEPTETPDPALAALGGIRRIALLTPYYPVANAEVRRYFADHGIETVRDVALRCPSWTAIAQVTEERCRTALRGLDGPDVDALVQVGTNLSMLRLADEAERWLGKPVVAINAATYWHALRADGINDRMEGFGSLLAAH